MLCREIGFCTGRSQTAVAAIHDVSERSAERCNKSDSLAILEDYYAYYENLLDKFESENKRFDYCYNCVGTDGTRQTISIAFDPYLSPTQQISGWEVLVSRRLISFGFANKDFHDELI